mgnify:CR=1 FL=1
MDFNHLFGLPGIEAFLAEVGTVPLVILVLFYLVFLIQFFVYTGGYFPLLKLKSTISQRFILPPVSIIICAKNEAKNLEKYIPAIMQQDYPEFELIVVDDGSWDSSIDLLMNWAKQYPNFRHTRTLHEDDKRDLRGKKFALTIGIKASKYEHLVFTDADCVPESDQWLQTLVGGFENCNMVLGYGAYEMKPTLVNRLIRFETFKIAKRYFAFANLGKAYMGVGRNMAYTKSSFYDLFGFRSHIHVQSGDDDLFIQDFSKQEAVAICPNNSANTLSIPKQSWKEWIRQKRRHISTSSYYRSDIKRILIILELSSLFFFLGFVTLPLLNVPIVFWFPLFVVQLVLQYIFYYKFSKQLGEQKLWLLHPLYEVFIWLFQALITLSVWVKKPKHW